MLEQNVAIKINTFVKLDPQKSLILQVLLYGFRCDAGRTEIQILENIQNQESNG